ncbi:hypothetical protein KXD96_15415 [Mycobacterium sp. SMC-2]|uniref:hypothetical protein n=1 Tax=Mycobacterium sp. SMC-2 TaxID=2857058 RepID=UPI0021B1CED0|nr:hypothetical protein [Mycobacterium sp. SMC-2]UXA04418.1 hypothetical protein KXD96_15415 [Mycobacterium sp. SMC-2]
MAGKRSQRTPQLRTSDDREIDFVGNAVVASALGRGRSAEGEFRFDPDAPFEVRLPFGKATFAMGSLIPLGQSGLHVPSVVDVDFSKDRTAPSRRLKIEVRDGHPMCSEIHLVARPGGRGLRNTDVRALADLGRWTEEILNECNVYIGPDGIPSRPGSRDSLKEIGAARVQRRKISPTLLKEVANAYRSNVTKAPTRAVADSFDVPYRTAARWVELCRSDEFGLLPKTKMGKKHG